MSDLLSVKIIKIILACAFVYPIFGMVSGISIPFFPEMFAAIILLCAAYFRAINNQKIAFNKNILTIFTLNIMVVLIIITFYGGIASEIYRMLSLPFIMLALCLANIGKHDSAKAVLAVVKICSMYIFIEFILNLNFLNGDYNPVLNNLRSLSIERQRSLGGPLANPTLLLLGDQILKFQPLGPMLAAQQGSFIFPLGLIASSVLASDDRKCDSNLNFWNCIFTISAYLSTGKISFVLCILYLIIIYFNSSKISLLIIILLLLKIINELYILQFNSEVYLIPLLENISFISHMFDDNLSAIFGYGYLHGDLVPYEYYIVRYLSQIGILVFLVNFYFFIKILYFSGANKIIAAMLLLLLIFGIFHYFAFDRYLIIFCFSLLVISNMKKDH